MRRLKPQYETFCRVYSEISNATRAAIEAGYSHDSAYNTGSRLLARPEIAARIQELRRRLAERESLQAPALLAKLETAFAQAVHARNPLAIVRVIELQARIAGLIGAKRDGRAILPPNEDAAPEPERAPVDAPRPRAASRKPRRAAPQPLPQSVAPESEPEPEPEAGIAAAPVSDGGLQSDGVAPPGVPSPIPPVVGHDELPPDAEDGAGHDAVPGDAPEGAHDESCGEGASAAEEAHRQEAYRRETQRLALLAVARARARKRQHRPRR